MRPKLAGALAGCTGGLVAIGLLWLTKAMPRLEISTGGSALWLSIGAVAGFAAAGAVFGKIFSRAANDPCGSWLFGVSYGFVTWLVGPGALLVLVFGGPLAKGDAGLALFGAHLLYGIVLGLTYPMFQDLASSPWHSGTLEKKQPQGKELPHA